MPRMGIQPGDVTHGIGTVGTTAVALNSDNYQSMLVQAASGNSGTIFFGGSGVTASDGYPRTGGQEFEASAKGLYVIGSAAGQVYRWIAVRL